MSPLRAVTALLGLALAGSLAAGVAPASAADPMAGAPEAGSCYRLTLKEVWQPSTAKSSVDCAQAHTLVVGAVGEVAAAVDLDDEKAVMKEASRVCNPFWNRQLSTSKVTQQYTLLEGYWLMPTPAQIKGGSRWISCLAGLSNGAALLPISGSTLPRASRRPDDSIARCAQKNYRYTSCAKKHSWRATYAFATTVKGSKKARFKALEKRAIRVCGRRVTTRRFTFSVKDLSRTKFVVVCYANTRR